MLFMLSRKSIHKEEDMHDGELVSKQAQVIIWFYPSQSGGAASGRATGAYGRNLTTPSRTNEGSVEKPTSRYRDRLPAKVPRSWRPAGFHGPSGRLPDPSR